MSTCYHLVCEETKKEIWVGQGSGDMANFYSKVPEMLQALGKFLRDHEGKNIVLVADCDFDEELFESYSWKSK